MEVSSKALRANKPIFIFERLKNDMQSQELVDRLEKAQKKIQDLLQSKSFLQDVLTLIFEEPPRVDIPPPSQYVFSPTPEEKEAFPSIIAERVDEAIFLNLDDFIQGMMDANKDARVENFLKKVNDAQKFHYPKAFVEAKKALDKGKRFFATLAEDGEYKEIVPQKLYYKTVRQGDGDAISSQTEAIMHFKIVSLDGDVLIDTRAYSSPRKVMLSACIPGFAHGVQGMQLGEVREIWIHPDFGYGVYTTLKKGAFLKVDVELFELALSSQNSRIVPLDSLNIEAEIQAANEGDAQKYHSACVNRLGFMFWKHYKKGNAWYSLDDVVAALRRKERQKTADSCHLQKLRLLLSLR